jgi:hypothetical protein
MRLVGAVSRHDVTDATVTWAGAGSASPSARRHLTASSCSVAVLADELLVLRVPPLALHRLASARPRRPPAPGAARPSVLAGCSPAPVEARRRTDERRMSTRRPQPRHGPAGPTERRCLRGSNRAELRRMEAARRRFRRLHALPSGVTARGPRRVRHVATDIGWSTIGFRSWCTFRFLLTARSRERLIESAEDTMAPVLEHDFAWWLAVKEREIGARP